MLYPTHCTGMVVPVTGERLTEVHAIGWGDGHEVLTTNMYVNPFFRWAFVADLGVLARGGRRHGARRVLRRPGVIHHGASGVLAQHDRPYRERWREAGAIPTAQPPGTAAGAAAHEVRPRRAAYILTHEFISAIVENRHPAVNVWEALA